MTFDMCGRSLAIWPPPFRPQGLPLSHAAVSQAGATATRACGFPIRVSVHVPGPRSPHWNQHRSMHSRGPEAQRPPCLGHRACACAGAAGAPGCLWVSRGPSLPPLAGVTGVRVFQGVTQQSFLVIALARGRASAHVRTQVRACVCTCPGTTSEPQGRFSPRKDSRDRAKR